jgi:hypothetical protein
VPRALADRLACEAEHGSNGHGVQIGAYRGFWLYARARRDWAGCATEVRVAFRDAGGRPVHLANDAVSLGTDIGVFASVDARLRGLDRLRDGQLGEVASLRQQAASLAQQIRRPWADAAEYERVARDHRRVRAALVDDGVEVTEGLAAEPVSGSPAAPDTDVLLSAPPAPPGDGAIIAGHSVPARREPVGAAPADIPGAMPASPRCWEALTPAPTSRRRRRTAPSGRLSLFDR